MWRHRTVWRFATPVAIATVVASALPGGAFGVTVVARHNPRTTVGAAGPRRAPAGGNGAGLTSVSCPGIRTCYALYYDGASQGVGDGVLSTSNGGKTWGSLPDPLRRLRAADPANNNSLTALACPTPRVCYGVGTGHTIMATADGGQTWRARRNLVGQATHLTDVACPTVAVCYAVGEDGAIVATTDGGRRAWISQDSGMEQDLTAVACPTVRSCYAVGNGGAIVATMDGGATWARQTAPGSAATAALFSIGCVDARACVVGGQYGLVLGTTNGGRSWRVNNAGTDDLYGMTCAGAHACYAVGRTGAIALTRDAAATWTTLPSGTHNDLASIACPSATACYAVGAGAIIVASTDGGRTWRSQPNPLGGGAGDGTTPGRDTGAQPGTTAPGAATAVQAVGMVVVRSNANPSRADLGPDGIVPCSPGQGSNGVVYTRDTGCPITARLEARLQAILSSSRGADPICGCQNFSRLRIVLVNSTADRARVDVTWLDFGPGHTRTFVVLHQGGRWLVDDEYPAGRPDQDIYHDMAHRTR